MAEPSPERGIRTKDWLYVRQPTRRKLFFDQNAEPDELNNLVDDPQYNAIMDHFDEQIETEMDATNDNWDMPLDFPPADFLTHEDAKGFIEKELMKNEIVVN